MTVRGRETRICGWCLRPVVRWPSQFRSPYVYCGFEHSGKGLAYRTALRDLRVLESEMAEARGEAWEGRGVPGMSPGYPATERDEDSEYEYAREQAAEANGGWR